MDDQFMQKFTSYADKKEVKKNDAGYKRSEMVIKTQLKALMARDLLPVYPVFLRGRRELFVLP